MKDCPKLSNNPNVVTPEDKLRECQNCEYYKAEYGVYLCTYNKDEEETT